MPGDSVNAPSQTITAQRFSSPRHTGPSGRHKRRMKTAPEARPVKDEETLSADRPKLLILQGIKSVSFEGWPDRESLAEEENILLAGRQGHAVKFDRFLYIGDRFLQGDALGLAALQLRAPGIEPLLVLLHHDACLAGHAYPVQPNSGSLRPAGGAFLGVGCRCQSWVFKTRRWAERGPLSAESRLS